MRLLFIFCLSFFLLSVPLVYATENLTAYEKLVAVPRFQITEPTVVELEFPIDSSVDEVMVLENENQTAQPITTKLDVVPDTRFSVETSYGNGSALTDTNRNTFIDYPISAGGTNEAIVTINFFEPTTINGIFLEFSDFSMSPDSIKIHTQNNGVEQVILNFERYTNSTIRFPTISATNLVLTVTYTQPIRLTRIGTYEVKQQLVQKKLIRFLAKPDKTYTAYLNSDRRVNTTTNQAGNLFQESNPLRFILSTSTNNPEYVPNDSDLDGKPDEDDNCPQIANENQHDTNGNGTGDLCDDTDFDNIINSSDNCPEDANTNQQDVDGDGLGDICDGQESRFTEQYPWLPWVAMGGTAVIISGLVFQMSKSKAFREETTPAPPDDLG